MSQWGIVENEKKLKLQHQQQLPSLVCYQEEWDREYEEEEDGIKFFQVRPHTQWVLWYVAKSPISHLVYTEWKEEGERQRWACL